MTPEEARDLARLSGRAASGVEGLVESTHKAVSDDLFDAVARAIGPEKVALVRGAHGLITAHTFFWVRNGIKAATWAAGTTAHAVTRGSETGLGGVPAQGVLGVVNGINGDLLEADGSTLATVMGLRDEGGDVALETEALAAAYGSDRERVVVFLHGLVETEHAWRYRSQQRWGEPGVSYASRLREETDWAPLVLRYNTGRPIRDNAGSLSDLLSEVVRHWPCPLREIVLVGHSMGGLVSLTAVAQGDPTWTGLVRSVVTLGTPREGAPLERAAAVAEKVTETVAPWRWFGGILQSRSKGIRDLHSALDHPPLPERVQECIILATLTPESWHPRLRQVGDGLVPIPKVRTDELVVLPGLHHLDLLNHPLVYGHLRAWLGAPPQTPGPAPELLLRPDTGEVVADPAE